MTFRVHVLPFQKAPSGSRSFSFTGPITPRATQLFAVMQLQRDAAFIRQALLAAADIFSQAKAAGGPGYQALAEAALDVPAGRPLAGVHYDVCLAVDHIDFPTPVRSTR
jgi:hypothetical protein